MEKVVKSYVEKSYRGLLFSEASVNEVLERDPMKIENDGSMQGFRFYDKEFVVDGEKSYIGETSNYSNWIYFGERLSLEEAKNKYGNDSHYRILIDNMERNNYEYVCYTQVGSFLVLGAGDMTFDEYLSLKEKEKITSKGRELKTKRMFNKLKKHIGEEVSYVGWWYGVKQEEIGELKEVNDFSNVVIGCSGIPFVGYGAAISSIKSKDGETLYLNPAIEIGYDRRKNEDVFAAQRMIFGDRITDFKIAEKEKSEKEWNEFQEKSNAEAKKMKYVLMREGISLVKPETIEEWLNFVDINTNDGYSACIVKAVISMIKKLDEGISFEEAEHKVYTEELGLTGFMAGAATSALSHFAKNGDEYRKEWNKQYGIDDDEKGTVNPAILTLNKNK
ncbi:MAG: hypothetical protein HFI86_03660 [Bacilli bacterium]|nr:hypothetical protein [Bacilli bacterium]